MTTRSDQELFSGPVTYMGAPHATRPIGSKAAILGVPFDCGVHPVRIGSRLGPRAIREQSALVRPYQPPLADFNPLTRLNLVDCGDVRVTPSQVGESFAHIEEATRRVVEAGAIPVTMGGDGSVTLPQLRAVHRKYADLVVLHFDAHTDTYDMEGLNTATTFTRAAEEGVVDPANSFHVGARGPVFMPGVFDHTRACGYNLIPGVEMMKRGIPDVLAELRERLAGRPVYLCFDMDFFDPSCAPGVATPTWGGVSAREGLELLQALSGLNFVAFDINTVSPPHDVGGMTAFLAGTVMLECLFLACAALAPSNLPKP